MPSRATLSRLVALLVLSIVASTSAVRACDSCSSPGAVLPAPVGIWQEAVGSTDSSCRTDVYAVDLQAGFAYLFTLCNWSYPPATASFNARLRVLDPSCSPLADVDDSCGNLPEAWVYPSVTGRHDVEISGSTSSDVGTYRLGYMKSCFDNFDCWSPAADLGPVTTSCRVVSGTVDCTATSYSVTLVQGQRYTFTLCDATCPGAGAAFNSILELSDSSDTTVATSSAACGDDGEIVYDTDPLTGGGTYCVRVVTEGGGGAFTLGYRVACQAPSALSLSPLVGGARLPGCSEAETFTLTSAGTPVFAVDWSITPPPGGSAIPATGSLSTTTNVGRFSSTLTGLGTYAVSVTSRNECGTSTRTFSYELRDRAAPDVTLSATTCGNHVAPIRKTRDAATRASLEAAQSSRAPLEPPPAVREASLVKQARLRDRPRASSAPPAAKSIGCATPCEFGVIAAYAPMYDVFLSCDDGTFTARTGANHPVTLSSGFSQNVIYGGEAGSPSTSDVAWMFHDVGLMYQDPTGGRACVFDPPDTPAEPNSIGIEMEWDVVPDAGLQVTLREEIVSFGNDETDSGVRLTLGATSSASSTRATGMGVRWQIDYQNAGDDGPLFATVNCDPPEIVDALDFEHELPPAEIHDFYRIQNNTGDPIFSNFTNTTAIAGFPDTGTPDRLVYGYWPDMTGSDWDRFVNEGDLSVDYDSAVHYWFGHDVASAITIAPGESFRRSVVIFTSSENADCGAFTPGAAANATITICEGECASLGAVAADACGAAFVDLVDQTVGSPPCSGNPCDVTFPSAGDWEYTWEGRDTSGNATRAVTLVHVLPPEECATTCRPTGVAPPPTVRTCEGAPVTLDASSMGLTGCAGSVITEWRQAGRVVGNAPTLGVSPSATTSYVVTVSCSADPACSTSATITVEVDRAPIPGAVRAADLASCNLGTWVEWDPATFFNGGGVYNLFRSEASCADALLQPPLAVGLTTLSWMDGTTLPGRTYFYVVQAEDDPAGTPCRPVGVHHGGPARTACGGPITDVTDGSTRPGAVWDALRVRHAGQAVTLDWTRARALLPGEHVHVLKSANDPDGLFVFVNGEAYRTPTWSETDTASRLQFFDVRVADPCENLSPKEYPIYPPGYDILR